MGSQLTWRPEPVKDPPGKDRSDLLSRLLDPHQSNGHADRISRFEPRLAVVTVRERSSEIGTSLSLPNICGYRASPRCRDVAPDLLAMCSSGGCSLAQLRDASLRPVKVLTLRLGMCNNAAGASSLLSGGAAPVTVEGAAKFCELVRCLVV